MAKKKAATPARREGGRHLSDETRARISEAKKGRPLSQETKDKLSAALKGRPLSPEHRAKIAAANRRRAARPLSPEHRAKIAAALKGRKHSPEHNARIAAAKKGRKLSPEHRAKMAAYKKGGIFVHRDFRDQVEPILEGRRARRPGSATSPDRALPAIRLVGPDEPFYLDGREQRELKGSEFDVIRALLEAGPEEGISGPDLGKKSGRGGWWRIVKRLLDDPVLGPLMPRPRHAWEPWRLLARMEPSP